MKISLYGIGFLLPGLLFFQTIKSYSQEKAPVNFGKVTPQDFIINSPVVDAGSSAVIIADVGTTKFEGNAKGWFTYIYKRQRRIKILDKKAFELATVQVQLYQNEDSKEKMDNLSASTYNLEDGKVTEVKLASKEVYDSKEDKNYSYKKFTLPAVKEGSIIEYSYTIKSDFEFNLPAWEFQSDACPTLWSEYNLTIPGLLSYMSFPQVYKTFFIDKAGEGSQNYAIRQTGRSGGLEINKEQSYSISSPTTIHRWVMKDVPVFNVESYISSPRNFINRISFQLYQTYDGQDYHDVANSWKKVAEELIKREDFGVPLQEDNQWLDEVLQRIVTGDDNQLQVAKKIYYYIQNNYTCTNHYNKYIKTTLKEVVKKKSGTVGDINLLLTAFLIRANIQAAPVLMSTRDVGRNSATFPIMEKLNYVICKAKINDVDYYLDATKAFLGFGKLPLECYNGHARIISKYDTTSVYFLTDSIKESASVNVFISNTDKGEVVGNYNHTMGFFESLDTKNKIATAGIGVYKTGIKDLYPEDFLVSNIRVDSFQLPEDPVSVKFDFKLKLFENADIIYFDPLMGEALKKNPFFAAERIYPVEMPYTTNELLTLNMDIPVGYKVEELPKSTLIKLNEDEGFFEYLIRADGKNIQLRRRLVLHTANFENKDYQTLRDFYTYIVKKDAEQIVFKKIK